MENVIDQLKALREKRQDQAKVNYSEVLLRYDKPHPEDAEALDAAMTELHIDMHRLESDLRLIVQYREYLAADGQPDAHGGKRDAQDIRKGSPDLFMAVNASKNARQGDKVEDLPA